MAELHKVLAEAQERLRPVASRANVKTAIGLAVPAIEAWYVCGLHPNVSEAAWIRALASGAFDYTRNDLKREAYGTDRPSLPMETRKAEEQARRLAAQLDLLERQFPIGFGALAADVRGW